MRKIKTLQVPGAIFNGHGFQHIFITVTIKIVQVQINGCRLLRSRFLKICNFLAKLALTAFSSQLKPELVTDNCKQPSGLKKMEICAILPDLVI